MSELSITVSQEVQAILAVQAANYRASASVLEGEAATFYLDVAAELAWILDDARERAATEPEEDASVSEAPFPVGSKVLLAGEGWDGGYDGVPVAGNVVKITRVDGNMSLFEWDDSTEWSVTDEGDGDGFWGGVLVDDEIREGDTVRILPLYKEVGSAFQNEPNQPGVEFVVTKVVACVYEHGTYGSGPDSGLTSTFYVEGDPEGRGIWESFIEKVHQ